jgi:serine/threonine protein kinase
MIGQYKLIRQLGDGMFGTGMLAEDTSKDNKRFCVKLFKGLDQTFEESFNTEMMAGQAKIFHPNVLRLCGAGKSKMTREGVEFGNELFFIVSELADNGEAFDYVEMADGLQPEYSRQLFS